MTKFITLGEMLETIDDPGLTQLCEAMMTHVGDRFATATNCRRTSAGLNPAEVGFRRLPETDLEQFDQWDPDGEMEWANNVPIQPDTLAELTPICPQEILDKFPEGWHLRELAQQDAEELLEHLTCHEDVSGYVAAFHDNDELMHLMWRPE